MRSKPKIESHFGTIKKSRFIQTASQWATEKIWKERAQDIALELLDFLDEQNLTQKALAEMMDVSPQVVNKWLKGQENFTLETIGKMEAVIKRSLLQVVNTSEKTSIVTEELDAITEVYKWSKPPMIPQFENSAKIIPIQRSYYSTAK